LAGGIEFLSYAVAKGEQEWQEEHTNFRGSSRAAQTSEGTRDGEKEDRRRKKHADVMVCEACEFENVRNRHFGLLRLRSAVECALRIKHIWLADS